MHLLKIVIASLVSVLTGSAAASEPIKIRISWTAPVSNWASILLEKKDLARHYGKSYTLEPIRIGGTPPMIQALANNELEIANLTYSTVPIAIANAGMEDLRIIADEFQDGVNNSYSNEFLVLKDSPIRSVHDLKGRVIGTNAVGSAVDIAGRAMLRKNGLEDKRDYTVLETPFPAMRAMLAEKKVDLIPAVIPFSFDPALREIARPLFTQKDAIGESQMAVFVARKAFIDKNRAAVVDFLEDFLRIARWYLDPANHKEAAQIAARFTKLPAERFEGWLFTQKDYYRDSGLVPNLDALQKNIDLTKELGFIRDTIDVRKHSDLTLLQEASARLK